VRRLAAFQNPEFYKKQAMRLSTHATPRVITCAEDTERFVGLPRGCQEGLVRLIGEWGTRPILVDERVTGEALHVSFRGHLTRTQDRCAAAIL
jgi:hypothetical protein